MITEIKDIDTINKFLKKFNTSIDNIGVYKHYKIISLDNNIVGFLSYDLIYDRIEIEYIYVDISYRKKGIASTMLDDLFKTAKDNNCKNITLEVKVSNYAARRLYELNGFADVAIRKNYYLDEDGILMMKEM